MKQMETMLSGMQRASAEQMRSFQELQSRAMQDFARQQAEAHAHAQRFLGLDNVILQPHQGSATQETRAAMALLQFRNLACYADGAPLPTCVTKVCTPA